ncbi:MAG: hypothetical protein QM479_07225, partial [Pseudomonadota bacterium]
MLKIQIFLTILMLPLISRADDTYIPSSGDLYMPSVVVGSKCYEVNMVHQGNLVFKVSSAKLNQKSISTNSIIIEPDNFSPNSTITTSVSNVTLSATGTDTLSAEIFAIESSNQASTGTQVFGYNSGSFEGRWYTPERVLRIDFVTPTNFVSIDVKGFDSFDSGKMEIYDKTNNLLSSISSVDLVDNKFDTLSTGVRSAADVSYALVFGSSIQDAVGIDNLKFNEIKCSDVV